MQLVNEILDRLRNEKTLTLQQILAEYPPESPDRRYLVIAFHEFLKELGLDHVEARDVAINRAFRADAERREVFM